MNYSQSESNNIVRYYQECNNAYKDAWDLDKNMQLNLGLWKKKTKSLTEALNNLNKEIAFKLDVKPHFNILDAGCGVGGTAIYLAKTFGCKVIGISLVPNQIEQAKKNAAAAQVDHLVTFIEMNYINTRFSNATFDSRMVRERIC